jgi:hypothetical protein
MYGTYGKTPIVLFLQKVSWRQQPPGVVWGDRISSHPGSSRRSLNPTNRGRSTVSPQSPPPPRASSRRVVVMKSPWPLTLFPMLGATGRPSTVVLVLVVVGSMGRRLRGPQWLCTRPLPPRPQRQFPPQPLLRVPSGVKWVPSSPQWLTRRGERRMRVSSPSPGPRGRGQRGQRPRTGTGSSGVDPLTSRTRVSVIIWMSSGQTECQRVIRLREHPSPPKIVIMVPGVALRRGIIVGVESTVRRQVRLY